MTRPRLLPVRRPDGRVIGYYPSSSHARLTGYIELSLPQELGRERIVAGFSPLPQIRVAPVARLTPATWSARPGEAFGPCYLAEGDLAALVRIEGWRAPG